MQEKLMALSTPEKAIAGGGVLMLIASFFDWFHANFEGIVSVGRSGWGAPGSIWSVLAILISLALAAAVLVPRLGNVMLPALPENVTWGKVFGGGAAAIVVLILLKAWRIMDVPIGGFGIGFFIAIVATAAIAYGGYMIYSEEKSGMVSG